MAYLTLNDLAAAIPAPLLNDACDDDRDGVADAGLLDQIILRASAAVDSYLASLYPVPFVSPPPVVIEAALIFACEMIFARRLQPEESNPYQERAKTWRIRLEQIGADKLPLDAALVRVFAPGAVLSEPIALDATLR